ncbi:uncharacterized protein LY79DRAFT_29270 [Colletotrichum navitas]|uniref:Uncharacterized protein n=1 Tax=Colletotrichum navitas TaxID=681940 RepID=A0AAD8VD26_9PEZI|nr:uncharacterized protein LY79DRAFT_29270 [Colletotrichum navitas]KAK1600696.1 hypothetical protein LY79DRAFT_29270 [Colletotrichum navitas]
MYPRIHTPYPPYRTLSWDCGPALLRTEPTSNRWSSDKQAARFGCRFQLSQSSECDASQLSESEQPSRYAVKSVYIWQAALREHRRLKHEPDNAYIVLFSLSTACPLLVPQKVWVTGEVYTKGASEQGAFPTLSHQWGGDIFTFGLTGLPPVKSLTLRNLAPGNEC